MLRSAQGEAQPQEKKKGIFCKIVRGIFWYFVNIEQIYLTVICLQARCEEVVLQAWTKLSKSYVDLYKDSTFVLYAKCIFQERDPFPRAF